MLRPRNWKKFQHYASRCPTWIKVHADLLKNKDWFKLKNDKSLAWTLVSLWLIASEDVDGKLPELEDLEFRLQMDKEILTSHLSELNQWFNDDDSIMLADCEQSGVTERETERETDISFVEKFNDFWKEYPSLRKVGRKPCETKWKRNGLDKHADEIISHVKKMKLSKQWKDGFSPAPLTYINQERWKDDTVIMKSKLDGCI